MNTEVPRTIGNSRVPQVNNMPNFEISKDPALDKPRGNDRGMRILLKA